MCTFSIDLELIQTLDEIDISFEYKKEEFENVRWWKSKQFMATLHFKGNFDYLKSKKNSATLRID